MMLRRKPRAEREQRPDELEHARQYSREVHEARRAQALRKHHGTDYDARDERPLPREVERYYDELRELAKVSHLPPPRKEPLEICSRHPDWRPSLRPWQPPPPPSTCPFCVEEAARPGRRAEASEALASVKPQEVPHSAYPPPTPVQELAWRRHVERLRAGGQVVAGTPEEKRAVARADKVRHDEMRRDRPRKPDYVSWDGKRTYTSHALRALWDRRSGRGRPRYDYDPGGEIVVQG